MARRILANLQVATMTPGETPYGLTDGAIGIEHGRVAFVGDVPVDWRGV